MLLGLDCGSRVGAFGIPRRGPVLPERAMAGCAAGLAFISITLATAAPTTTGQAARDLPDCYHAEGAFTVRIAINAPSGAFVIGLEDSPPVAWSVENISDGGVWDPINGKVKWGPFFAPLPTDVSYLVTPPPETNGSACFRGMVSFDGVNHVVVGDSCIHRGCDSDAECDDGIFCNGAETCLPDGCCQRGDDPCPDDGAFCNGNEFCDEWLAACEHGGDPCAFPECCDENAQQCVSCLACAVDCDRDGVCDDVDICPCVPAPMGVDAFGRPHGDLDDDCDVDLEDFQILVAAFGASICTLGDLDDDCDVDLADFQIFQANFTGPIIPVRVGFDPSSVLFPSFSAVPVDVYLDVAGLGPVANISVILGSNDVPLGHLALNPALSPCLPVSSVDMSPAVLFYTHQINVNASTPLHLPCSHSTSLLLGTITISSEGGVPGCFTIEVNYQQDDGGSTISLDGADRPLLGVLKVCWI